MTTRLSPYHASSVNLEITMKTKLISASLVAAAFAISVGGASAQSTPSRQQIKSETRAAERAGRLTPAGEGPIFGRPSLKSTKTRAERKAETKQARAAGELEPAGDAVELKEDQIDRSRPSTVNRAERKAATRAAEKAGRLVPAGQGPGASDR